METRFELSRDLNEKICRAMGLGDDWQRVRDMRIILNRDDVAVVQLNMYVTEKNAYDLVEVMKQYQFAEKSIDE
jgi:alkyl hydroperoxide reductase subunit AhpC